MRTITVKTPKCNRIRTNSRPVSFVIYLVVGISALVTLIPFIFIISASLSDPQEVVAGNVWLIPKGFSLLAYEKLFKSGAIWRPFANSIFFTIVITSTCVMNSMLTGYALIKRDMPFRKLIIIFILIPMYFSGGLIPTFIMMTKYGLYNSLLAIILPSIVNIWNIILARTYINGIPASLKEAAIIDGAGELRVFASIIVPLSKPILAVLCLYTALGVWNSWFYYMIFLPTKIEWHPVQMYLTKVLIWGSTSSIMGMGEGLDPQIMQQRLLMASIGSQLKYAVMVVVSVPIIAIYPFVQKYFIQGALVGSLKE